MPKKDGGGGVQAGWLLSDFLRQAAWRLAALHVWGNCFIAPHFLQTPELSGAMNQ
jgi:hypothetical protein